MAWPLLLVVLSLLLGVLVGMCVTAVRRRVLDAFEGEAVTDEEVLRFAETAAQSVENSELTDLSQRFKCELASSQGMPKCTLMYKEGDGAVEQDVKCRKVMDAMGIPRGSYQESGMSFVDKGRLRTNPTNLDQCEILPTDSILKTDVSPYPMCSAENPNLFDASRGHGDVVEIAEAPEEGRCRITFKTLDKPDIIAYANYLDERSREADLELLSNPDLRGVVCTL
eukprot:jgi/Tetstr1/454204/TSEL_041123.t1